MRYFVTLEGTEHIIDVADQPGGGYAVSLLHGEQSIPVSADISGPNSGTSLRIDGQVVDLVMEGQAPTLSVFASGKRVSAQVETARTRAAASLHGPAGGKKKSAITSPMPGKIVKVLVEEGARVEEGAPVIVVEAMKMENELLAPKAGEVSRVFVKTGDAVEGGAKLVAIS